LARVLTTIAAPTITVANTILRPTLLHLHILHSKTDLWQHEHSSLLASYAVSTVEKLPTFRRSAFLSVSG
jgi:hypothetical protein